jgi:hypothetical protein
MLKRTCDVLDKTSPLLPEAETSKLLKELAAIKSGCTTSNSMPGGKVCDEVWSLRDDNQQVFGDGGYQEGKPVGVMEALRCTTWHS